MELRAEFTDCAGDVSTVAWCSADAFVCGTTTHSDARNQQYNKPGTLLLGSYGLGTLRAYPQHRVVRPIVQSGENSTDAMIQSQDPWLYTSVVGSDYDPVNGRAFTSGYDKTARVWKVDASGGSMAELGTWHHEGVVNFVVASKHDSGMVATAADVPLDAVRVYCVDETNISDSTYRSYSCSRVVDADGRPHPNGPMGLFPGYYPMGGRQGRLSTSSWSATPHEAHPEMIRTSPKSGATRARSACGDGLTGERWKLTGSTSQNVFEGGLASHPGLLYHGGVAQVVGR